MEPFIASTWLDGGMAVLDPRGHLLEANDGLANWLGKKPSELAGRDFAEILAAFSSDEKSLAHFLEGSAPFGRLTLKSAPTGPLSSQWLVLEMARREEICFVNLHSTLPPLSELEEAAWNEHLGDDSARRDMFMRLLRAEQQLDRLLRCWPCVVFSQRPDFSLHFASPNIGELTGISAEDWSRQPRRFWELVHELDASELQQHVKRAVQGGVLCTHTYRLRHALTGRVIYVLEYRQPVISRNGLLLGYDAVWLDVTRQTIAEKRLSTAAWKETLAVLTLGMAHDFRNMMAGLHSLSESFLIQVDDRHPFMEGLWLIQKSSMQASQLVQRMINLHIGQTGERNYHDLNEIARDLVELVSKLLPRRILVRSS